MDEPSNSLKPIGGLTSGLLDRFNKPRSNKTERGELMREFMIQLNVGRKEGGFRPLTMGRMAKIFEGLSEADLYYLKSYCKQSKNFSSSFWWKLGHTKNK